MNVPSESLSRRAARAAAWTLAGNGARQVVGLALTVTLARLLTLEDFGVFAVAMVLVSVANELRDIRLSDALIQRRELREADLRAAFTGTVLAGLATGLLLGAAAPFMAIYYHDKRLLWMGLALAAGPLIESCSGVSRALLMRGLKHKWIAATDLLALVVGGGIAVVLAARSQGPWALVAFNLAGSCVTALMLLLLARWFPRPGVAADSLRALWGFSSFYYCAQIMGQAGRSVDKLVVGKISLATLGAYRLASQLMMMPVEQVSWALGRVMLPALSELQGDPERLRRAFLRAVRLLGLVTFPVSAGLFVTADEFTLVVYGDRWASLTPLLRILSIAGFVGAIASSINWVFFTLGETRKQFHWMLAQAAGLAAAALIGSHWRAQGVAFGVVAATFLFTGIGFRISLKLIGIRGRELLDALLPTAGYALIMVAFLELGQLAIIAATHTIFPVPDAVMLAGKVTAGALIYIGCLWVCKAEAWRDGVQMLREFV